MKKSEWATLIGILVLFVLWAEGRGREDGAGDLAPLWASKQHHNSFVFTSSLVPMLPERPDASTCQEEPLCTVR
jgi:hypothetical protein